MPPISADDTVKFLIACITCKEGDKIDFEKVAFECQIVSKAAASKRYERIVKKAKEDDEKQKAQKAAIANGEEPPVSEETPKKAVTPRTPRTPKPKAAPKEKKETAASAKKRKLAEVKKEEEAAEEVEGAAMKDAGEVERPSIFGRPEDDVKVEV
ncbi:hypothetical protein EG328_006236 [Venturia inaequalis]|uniref:Myb-like DNA-binding domain-containing protein n=1 Tax=Venturia inaequalis TaxID=5025 RepID=A0A8H3VEJ2_VENIN|nr:hypothetical protein EG328_006236 [Venturia inaequalis]